MIRHNRANSVLCKPLLLALDAMIFSIRINGAVVHNLFITWGAFGATQALYYKTGLVSADQLYPPCRRLASCRPAVLFLHGTLAVSGISK